MSKMVRDMNWFFRYATKAEIDAVLSKIILTERQQKIFECFYLKKHDVCFIADTIGVCDRVVKKELMIIRSKIQRSL